MFAFLRKAEAERSLEELPVSRIVPNPNQPRRHFDEAALASLAESIKREGLLRPLAVRKKGARYELISGERRLRAIKQLGYKRVLCIVDRSAGEEDSALIALIENTQREDPDFFEEGECCLRLMNRLRLSPQELAWRIGKSRGFVAGKLRLLKLEPSVRESIRRFALSERHASAVLKLDETESRLELVRMAGEGRLSAIETEKLARRMLNQTRAERRIVQKPRAVTVWLVKDYRVFINTVDAACDKLRSGGLKVEMDRNEREDGLDIVIRVTMERVKGGGSAL